MVSDSHFQKVTNRRISYPFRLSAPAMIFGHDIVENADILATMVDNVEIVLFHTPTQNNYLSRRDIIKLSEISRQTGVSYTVHLPTALEVASPDTKRREGSVQMAKALIERTLELNPLHYILHVPYSPPTLVYEPGMYFKHINNPAWQNWLGRAADSLTDITTAIGKAAGLLVENINYSVCYLEPLVQQRFCDLCLDVGHLLLGREPVTLEIIRHRDVIREIHIHGVKGHTDHHSLSILPQKRLSTWLRYISGMGFSGILNLEVFSPADLNSSLDLIPLFKNKFR